MGDMADDFRALSAHPKGRRSERREANEEILKSLGVSVTLQSKGVYRAECSQGVVMYYPASSKWQCRGRIYRGTPVQFADWLKKTH